MDSHSEMYSKTSAKSSFDDDLKTYRNCSNLQMRLLSLPGFAVHFEALLDSESSDPVTCIRELFSSGIPLCYLFNLLPNRLYPRIELDFTTSRNDSYAQRVAIAQFALRVNQAFKCDHFTVSDMLSTKTTSGFDKALNAVSVVLDQLSLASSGISKPFDLNSRTASQNNMFSRAINSMLSSERNHVAKMEILEDFSSALATAGVLDSESLSLIFPKKMFIFARKFRIQLECIAQLPWREQNWGAPFVSHAMDMTMNLRIHCVNWILLKPALEDFDMETLKANLPYLRHCEKLDLINFKVPRFKATSRSVNTLVSVPLERLSYYCEFLTELTSLSAFTNHKHDKEMHLGIACIKQVMDTTLQAQKKAISDQVCETLKTRIADWQSLEIDKLGQLILRSNLLTRRNGILQNFDLFLFENELLLCDETLPPPPNPSRIGRRRASSASIPSSKVKSLYIKDHIPIRSLTSVTRSEYRRVQDDGLHLFYELALYTGDHVVSLLYPDHDDMQKWYHEFQLTIQRNGEDKDRGMVQRGHVLPPILPDILSHRKRASTYSGTPTDIGSGPLPESLLTLRLGPHRSAFIRLHFGDNSFVLSVSLPVEFEDLLERIDRKLRYSPGWTLEGRIITHTSADGDVISVGPRTPLEPIFQEGTMVTLRVQ